MSWRTFAVLALLAAFLAAPLACSGRVTRVRWSDIRERYFIGFLKRNPVTATYLGVDGYSPDLADIDSCDAVLAAFTAPDEGTAMEAWYAHSRGIRVVAYTGGTPAHPWTGFVAECVHASLEDAVADL